MENVPSHFTFFICHSKERAGGAPLLSCKFSELNAFSLLTGFCCLPSTELTLPYTPK